MIAGLRDRGLRLAICSNWDWDLDLAVDEVGLADAFDVVVSSAWAGARKPHPRIFEHTLAKVGVDPSAVLFVGDTWGPDVVGPARTGHDARVPASRRPLARRHRAESISATCSPHLISRTCSTSLLDRGGRRRDHHRGAALHDAEAGTDRSGDAGARRATRSLPACGRRSSPAARDRWRGGANSSSG